MNWKTIPPNEADATVPRAFSPFGHADAEHGCATCRHSIGWDSVHLYCQRARIVSVTPCGHWEREAGSD